MTEIFRAHKIHGRVVVRGTVTPSKAKFRPRLKCLLKVDKSVAKSKFVENGSIDLVWNCHRSSCNQGVFQKPINLLTVSVLWKDCWKMNFQQSFSVRRKRVFQWQWSPLFEQRDLGKSIQKNLFLLTGNGSCKFVFQRCFHSPLTMDKFMVFETAAECAYFRFHINWPTFYKFWFCYWFIYFQLTF